jgi:hypothetical protein
VLLDKSEQERRMMLRGGGVVEMWSLEDPDTARGRAYARVVVDEAASVPRLMYAVQQVIRPMLTDYSGDAWFISTPAGLNDFYTLYQWGQDSEGHPEWRSWQRPSSENPHIPTDDLEQAERDLPVRVWQEEYLAKFLPGGVGQYFDEWDSAVHICKPFDIPKEWRRFGMLDYGYNPDPLCYLQVALSPAGQGFMYREIYRTHVIDSDQATLIAEACAGDAPEYIAAGPDLWNKSGKGPRGQSTAETYEQVWRERGFSTCLKKADNNRIMGWRRVHEWLKPYPAPDLDPSSGAPRTTARLRVFEGRCPNLVRTLPLLIHDERKPQDVKADGEDHAGDCLRYRLMSRPAPKSLPQPNPPGDFDARAMLKQVENRRKRAGYIGHEHLTWVLDPAKRRLW